MRSTRLVFYALVMVAIIVAADLLFFRHRFRERLIANTSIVLLFAVFYLIYPEA